MKRNRGFTVRSAEDECGIPEDTGEHWCPEEAGEVEVAYAVSRPEDRARILREYITAAEYPEARDEARAFAEMLATHAGFSDREIRGLLHLKDGAVPAGGWQGVPSLFVQPCCASGAVFVFGSNLAGRHGAGAALHARLSHGAIHGIGQGPQGRSYAIPTKDERLQPLPLPRIERYVRLFLDHAGREQGTEFFVTRVGCGLAGYADADIAPMFAGAPANCILPEGWSR